MPLNSIISWPHWSRQPSPWNWPTSDWVGENVLVWMRYFEFGVTFKSGQVSRVWEMQTDSRHSKWSVAFSHTWSQLLDGGPRAASPWWCDLTSCILFSHSLLWSQKYISSSMHFLRHKAHTVVPKCIWTPVLFYYHW